MFAAHELAAIIDPAMTVKMTVQFNLFGGTVLKLGTDRHHKELLEGIDNLNSCSSVPSLLMPLLARIIAANLDK